MKFLKFKKKEEKRNRMSSWMDMLVNPKNNHIIRELFLVSLNNNKIEEMNNIWIPTKFTKS